MWKLPFPRVFPIFLIIPAKYYYIMYMKIHRYSGVSGIVAICDKELLNTTLTDGDLTIHVTEAFYGTTVCTEEEVKDVIEHATNCNLIGEKAVRTAIACGILDQNGYMRIGGVPHAQIYRT
ncbi:DUF424 domain-containing protein [Methanogenium cariaci]